MERLHCPHCNAEHPGPIPPNGVVDCERCDRSFAAPPAAAQPPPLAQASDPGQLPAQPAAHGSPADVSALVTGGVAAAATLLFYLIVIPPLRDTTVGVLFAERGWVPYAITFLAFWSLALLALKALRLSRQEEAFKIDLLPEGIAPRLSADTATAFESYLRGVEQAAPPSFLVSRVVHAVQLVRARRRIAEVLDQLAVQSMADANAVESSYTMLRAFVWAIPILGFIGTVMGIGAAVAGFSDSVAVAVDLEVMKESIGTVTNGLGVAFDTTLLALVMSIGIMLPASSLQKAEEDLLARVDRYCDTRLVRRLEEHAALGASLAGTGLAEAVERLRAAVDALDQRAGRA